MEHFGEFIDYDEGREDPLEPFFTYAVPCENCGQPREETRPADWNPEINVGPCCAIRPAEIPDEPICPGLQAALMSSDSVGTIVEACKEHRKYCSFCNPEADDVREAA